MYRLSVLFVLLSVFISCSKDESPPPRQQVPDVIDGYVVEITFDPLDINTPDKGTMLVNMQDAAFRVSFEAVPQAQSNATLIMATDSVLTDNSREFSNFGENVVMYTPVTDNEIVMIFAGGRKVTAQFTDATVFGGEFGKDQIAQWRTTNDPTKPNQKAKEDLQKFFRLYEDADGDGPGTAPTYLSATVVSQ